MWLQTWFLNSIRSSTSLMNKVIYKYTHMCTICAVLGILSLKRSDLLQNVYKWFAINTKSISILYIELQTSAGEMLVCNIKTREEDEAQEL